MRYPQDLQANGTIGFPAPSFGCATEPYKSAFDNALIKWQELGYRTLPGVNAYSSCGVGISNTPEKCAAELMEMYLSKNTDCLISCGGGELMCEILDYVDFEKLKEATPKWYLGYSDNTNFTYLLTTLCDVASIYGPCAGTYGMESWHESLTDTYELLTGKKRSVGSYALWEKESLKDAENPLVPYNVTEPNILKLYYNGRMMDGTACTEEGIRLTMTGRLLGGCMDCLVNLPGTNYDKTAEFCEKYKDDGVIWFLEACDINVFSTRRAMWQMEHAGWFQHVKGFMFGRPRNGEEMMGLDAYQAVLEVAGKYNVPVLMDLDIGHVAPMMPLVTGSIATVTVKGNSVEVQMEYR